MTTVAGTERPAAVRPATWADRVLAAVPLAAVFAWFAFAYAWQAWLVATPFVFIDELKYTQVARSLADSGTLSRRGEPAGLDTLAELATAPAWLVSDTATAYALVKAIGALAMTTVVFPTYALARMLVSRGWALFAAAASAAIPAFVYAGLVLEEPFAYPVAATFFWLLVRALVARTAGAWAWAAGVAAVAPLVRGQLAILAGILALAALAVAWNGERARRLRAGWDRWDRAGAILLVLVAVVALNSLFAQASFTWERATGDYKGRMLEYGLWAGGAFAIGIGLLPAVLGLASLAHGRGRGWTPAERAFALVLALAVAAFGLYTAAKAAHLSTVFGTRVAERNLIYLAPLLFVATAAWLARPRLRPLPLALAAAAVLLMVTVTPIVLEYPYFEAPGYSVLVAGNRDLSLPTGTLETIVLVALAAGLVLAVAVAVARARRPALGGLLAALVAGAILLWNVAGELYAAAGSNTAAGDLLEGFADPPDWVDRATGGADTLYLGKQVTNPNGVHLLEFWNRSISKVWSIDGSAPGPGRTVTPDLASTEGELVPDPQVPYVVADPGIEVVGRVVAAEGPWRLFRVAPPLRLVYSTTGLFADGWMSDRSGYSQFVTEGNRPGTMRVTVSRAGWTGKDVPGRVTIRLGTLVLGDDREEAQIGRVTATRRWTVDSGKQRTFSIPTPRPPFRVEVEISPTFVPAQLDPSKSDVRELGAVVGYGFVPEDAATR
ncbi:MAG TPA: hypothetical protein VK874_00050 [Gaiellaceae bacterium]|nr:hypothetical protein [Gaiellaceae bacterium]